MSSRSGTRRGMLPVRRAAARDVAARLRAPAAKRRSVRSDLREFVLHEPEEPTLIDSDSPEGREDYCRRILQRLDVRVDDYAVLNIHRIGVRAPVTFVFEELRRWDELSSWWPNRLAEIERVSGSLELIRVFFLGRRIHPFGLEFRLFGFNVIPLFELHALRIREVPGPLDCDNARYLLFDCRGGYPAGILAGYVRSPIADQTEADETQFFFAVGFDFDGKEGWRGNHRMNRLWEKLHNRVTANVLNRFKRDCETRFQELLAGERRRFG
jgi:hypothetical protein